MDNRVADLKVWRTGRQLLPRARTHGLKLRARRAIQVMDEPNATLWRCRIAKDRIETTVVNARFVKPLDTPLLLALARTKRLIVTVEEAYLAGGFGSAVMELLEENGLQDQVRVVRMGIPDRRITHGDAKLLLAKYGLDAEGI